jgi:hypothetical protein
MDSVYLLCKEDAGPGFLLQSLDHGVPFEGPIPKPEFH